MSDDIYKSQLDEVIGRTNEFVGYSVDKVAGVRDSAMALLRGLYDELDAVRAEISDVIDADNAISDSGRASAAASMRHELGERERALRSRRDDLDRRRVRVERVLGQCTSTMGRLRLALEVINNRIDTFNSLTSTGDVQTAILGLQFAESENKRLAREIHDGPVQQFAAVILMFEYLERLAERGDGEAMRAEVVRIKGEMKSALADFRGFLTRLQPVGLDMGLGRAMVRLADGYRERGIDFVADVDPEEDDFSTVLRTNIFRVVQEAASNAVRHGGATRISVVYRSTPQEISVDISDNGSGFDLEQTRLMATARGAHGLRNMRERVHFMNGTLHIDSEPGGGTEISVKVPLGEDADG